MLKVTKYFEMGNTFMSGLLSNHFHMLSIP